MIDRWKYPKNYMDFDKVWEFMMWKNLIITM